jgi:hypothetical protein
MDKSLLREHYTTNEVVRLILECVHDQQRNYRLDRVGAMARKIGRSRDEVKLAFQLLEQTGCGKYVRGAQARFEWLVQRKKVACIARRIRRR